jgi:hypothetical protein
MKSKLSFKLNKRILCLKLQSLMWMMFNIKRRKRRRSRSHRSPWQMRYEERWISGIMLAILVHRKLLISLTANSKVKSRCLNGELEISNLREIMRCHLVGPHSIIRSCLILTCIKIRVPVQTPLRLQTIFYCKR